MEKVQQILSGQASRSLPTLSPSPIEAETWNKYGDASPSGQMYVQARDSGVPQKLQLPYPFPAAFSYRFPSSQQAFRPFAYQPAYEPSFQSFTTIPLSRPIPQLPLFNPVFVPAPTMMQPQRVEPEVSAPKPPQTKQGKARSQESREEIKDGVQNSKSKVSQEKPASGGAYKRRNVYKSIIRHMFSYIRKSRDDIIKILVAAGHSMAEIEHAFFEVSCYNDAEQQKGNKKQSQSTIKKMIDSRSIYTYVLRETLNAMIKNWDEGKHGKVSSKNLGTYRDVCIAYYNEAAQVLAQEEQRKAQKPQVGERQMAQ